MSLRFKRRSWSRFDHESINRVALAPLNGTLALAASALPRFKRFIVSTSMGCALMRRFDFESRIQRRVAR
jgi:hypothetical protein